MAVIRAVPNLQSSDPGTGRRFFTHVLGLEVAMELDFITTYVASGNRQVQLSVLEDPSGLHPVYSIGVDDVDAAFQRARDDGVEIVYPLTDEPWGVRRFFVRDPTGTIANVVGHREPSS